MTIQQPRSSPPPRKIHRDSRTDALVRALVDHGLVAPGRWDDAVAVVDEVLGTQSAVAAPLRRRFAELAGYVGGAFVVAAGVIFSATQWPLLDEGQQVALLAGTAVLLAVVAVVVGLLGAGFAAMRAGADPVQRRLAGVLLVGAAGTAAGAVALQVDRMIEDYTDLPPLAAFATFTLVALVGYLLTPTLVGQVAAAVGAFALVPSFLQYAVGGDVEPVVFGLLVLAVGILWLALAERGVWREVAGARVVGCVLVLVGAQIPAVDWDHRWVGYVLLLVVAAVALAGYVARPAWPYLATGVVAVTIAVPEALLDWTDDSVGPAGVLLATGVTLLGAALLGLRIRKEVSENFVSDEAEAKESVNHG